MRKVLVWFSKGAAILGIYVFGRGILHIKSWNSNSRNWA